jgi:four helix bundle protein
VWQRAINVAEAAYRLTADFPKQEVYGMTSQIRRAAVAVAANIAEGHGREHSGSFVQFLRMARGSLKELKTHLILSMRVGLIAERELEGLLGRCDELGKMVRSLIRSIQRKQSNA